MSKLKALLNTSLGRKAEHMVVAFLAVFGTTLAFNGEHVLAAHGLSALKSAVPALLVTAVVAGWDNIRGQLPAPVVAEVEKVVEKVTKKKPAAKAPDKPTA